MVDDFPEEQDARTEPLEDRRAHNTRKCHAGGEEDNQDQGSMHQSSLERNVLGLRVY